MYTTLAFAAGNVGLINSTPSHVDGTARKSLGVRWFTGRTAYESAPVRHIPAIIAPRRYSAGRPRHGGPTLKRARAIATRTAVTTEQHNIASRRGAVTTRASPRMAL